MVRTKGTKEWACKNINFSIGCSNSCRYCYARRMADRFGRKKWDDWPNTTNREEIGEKHFKKINGVIMTPSSHDLTMENLSLAKKVLYNLLAVGNNLLIVSKPNSIVIHNIAQHLIEFKDQILWRFTIGTIDDKIREYWEPRAPSIKERLEVLEELYNTGWRTSVSIEPFLDLQVIDLIKIVDPFVTDTIWVGPMNKIHVLTQFWTNELTQLYSPIKLFYLKRKIDSIENPKIRYKDHFLMKIAKLNPQYKEIEERVLVNL